jgi:glycosyltransferase involved in cell wall biosynthesis
MKQLVSVIMPVYNQERYLADTIKSVLAQTFSQFEFLILDDGSSDQSTEIIKKYSETDRRIIAFFHSNSGKCNSTNFLVQEAKGKYCAFLDAVDLMLPDRLEKQVGFHLAKTQVDASSCHCQYINKSGKVLGTQYYPGLRSIDECRKAKSTNQTIQCAFTGFMATKNSFLEVGGLSPDKWYSEDFDFFNRLIDKGYNLVIIQETLMKYRLHASAATMQDPLYMFDKNSWVYDCIFRRRAGQPERSFDEFMKERQMESGLTKWRRRQFQYGQIYFRKAGISMMSKMYFQFLYQLLLASILSPTYVFVKLSRLSKMRPSI